jgi:hypothetical protein
MDVEELEHFIARRMRMSHVYQPLLIRLLLEAGGTATVRQLARGLAASDEAQVAYYETRIKQMPLPVLKRHGVVEKNGDLVSLKLKPLSFEQSVTLQAECNRRISSFLESRGQSAWTGMLESAPVSDSVRYDVLKRDRRCQLYGAGPGDDVLEVDHIVPRSKGGSNEAENLQVLCRACNRGKSNRDDQSFVK